MKYIQLSSEVSSAKKGGIPIVALESTIISHGMPYPGNYETAVNLENIARENGCCPATIFIAGGQIRIGATREEIKYLAKAKDVKKVSTRELAEVTALQQTGATTVAATMVCAHLAGIKVFATGGIGGVHRQAEESFDISADLVQLSRTPVIVISAGAKAILDIPKTLEYLETQAVPVYGWQTTSFPGFYSRNTPWTVKEMGSLEDLARIYRLQREMGLQSGILLANPVAREDEISWDEMAEYIDAALAEMKQEGISGKQVTPFLLSKITQLTAGRSLASNIKLVESNVKLACRLARQLNRKDIKGL